jgi:site-specific DNA-cytosine methylase
VDKANATIDLAECASDVSKFIPTIDQAECAYDVSKFIPTISLLDVWAGVSSFSEGFEAQSSVIVQDFAWVEKSTDAIDVLAERHGPTKGCSNFYSYLWKAWRFIEDLVICAGSSCCPFSVSGMRRRQQDPRAGQGMETAILAITLGALMLIMENVTTLVSEDYLHHIVTAISAYL